jgi:sigma-B regulation protein RsbU (phosphoserine phosphatase)
MNAPAIPLLIVDDDPVFALFVRQLVEVLSSELPCAPEWVDTAEKALEILSRQRYELVLLDYNLPGANGLQVLAQIQELPTAQQPAVIMLTASGNEAVAVEAMKRGAKDYLPKADLEVPPLTRALKSALAQKRLAEQVARYNAQMQAELDMARTLQQSLLPDKYPCFPREAPPEQSALRFEHRFHSTTALAGDFFGVLGLSDTEAGVFICDVMGHGVRSALVTAMVRALVDELAPRLRDPGQFLTEMNRKLAAILKQTDGPLYATAFYLIANPAGGQMRYANAGHPRPLHLQRRAGAASPLPMTQRGGPALGLFGQSAYATSRCPLAEEDLVLLFTDGLFEVVVADGEDYGQERLLAAARERMPLPLPKLLDELLADVRTFSGGKEFDDDVCLLGMEAARVS